MEQVTPPTATSSVDIRALNEKIQRESEFVELLNMETGKQIVGQKYMIERLLVGLLSQGHILLEGRRRKAAGPLEGTFDHGEEGYGLWLDPAVEDDPVYAEHWAGHRPVTVTIEEDQIVIRRAGDESSDDDE